MEVTTELLSLYDYLGRAAGGALGEKVNRYALIKKQSFEQRYVEQGTYKGMVFLYTREFLEEFFQVQEIFLGKNNPNDLPF